MWTQCLLGDLISYTLDVISMHTLSPYTTSAIYTTGPIICPSAAYGVHTQSCHEYFPALVPSKYNHITTLFSQPLFLSFTFLIILLPPDLHTSHLFESLLYSFTQIQSNRLQGKKVLCLIKIFPSPSQWSSYFQWKFMKEGFRN